MLKGERDHSLGLNATMREGGFRLAGGPIEMDTAQGSTQKFP